LLKKGWIEQRGTANEIPANGNGLGRQKDATANLHLGDWHAQPWGKGEEMISL
jgi:hypothetical protein